MKINECFDNWNGFVRYIKTTQIFCETLRYHKDHANGLQCCSRYVATWIVFKQLKKGKSYNIYEKQATVVYGSVSSRHD